VLTTRTPPHTRPTPHGREWPEGKRDHRLLAESVTEETFEEFRALVECYAADVRLQMLRHGENPCQIQVYVVNPRENGFTTSSSSHYFHTTSTR
jgi:hypothetical protein